MEYNDDCCQWEIYPQIFNIKRSQSTYVYIWLCIWKPGLRHVLSKHTCLVLAVSKCFLIWKPWYKGSFCSHSVLFSLCKKSCFVLKLTTLKVLIWPVNTYNVLWLWRGSLAYKLGQWMLSSDRWGCTVLIAKWLNLMKCFMLVNTLL